MTTCPKCRQYLNEADATEVKVERIVSRLTGSMTAALFGGSLGGLTMSALGQAVGSYQTLSAGIVGGLATACILLLRIPE